MSKFKLKALLVPKEYEKISIENVDPREYLKFLYLVDPTTTIEELEKGLCERFSRRYPDQDELIVLFYQDHELLDLDPQFEIQDVFNDKNNEIRVLVDNTFKSVTYTPEPGISTPIDFQKTSAIPGGVYSSQSQITPRRVASSSISSPVALAPPPAKSKPVSSSVPQKKPVQKSKNNRITSGMLESPPKSKENQLKNLNHTNGTKKSPIKNNSNSKKRSYREISSDESSSDNDSDEEDVDYEPDDLAPINDDDNEKIDPDEMIEMVEDIKSNDAGSEDDEFLNLSSKERAIYKELQINTVEGNPSMYLGRTKRRAAREANLIFDRSTPKPNKIAKPTVPASVKKTGTSKSSSRGGAIPTSAATPKAASTISKAKNTKTIPSTTTTTTSTTTSTSTTANNNKKPTATSNTPTKPIKTKPKVIVKPPAVPKVSIVSNIYSRLKKYEQKVNELMVRNSKKEIIGYDVITDDFDDGLRGCDGMYNDIPVDVKLYLTKRPQIEETASTVITLSDNNSSSQPEHNSPQINDSISKKSSDTVNSSNHVSTVFDDPKVKSAIDTTVATNDKGNSNGNKAHNDNGNNERDVVNNGSNQSDTKINEDDSSKKDDKVLNDSSNKTLNDSNNSLNDNNINKEINSITVNPNSNSDSDNDTIDGTRSTANAFATMNYSSDDNEEGPIDIHSVVQPPVINKVEEVFAKIHDSSDEEKTESKKFDLFAKIVDSSDEEVN